MVSDEVVIELKSVGGTPEYVTARMLSYLKATGLKRALVINFGRKTLVEGVHRISL